MKTELWYLILGLVLVVITLAGTLLKRLPLTVTIFYLGVGIILGPLALGIAKVDAIKHASLLERLSELAVIISLFTAGLKLRLPLRHARWAVPLRLAFVSMALTVGLVSLAAVYMLGLSFGAAVLLGAILAPTDPVLASDVQLESATDRDTLRFNITAEAGLNDGSAFPFVLLGLGLLGLHELGEWSWRWLVIDLLWAVPGGLVIGAVLGTLLGKLVLYLRHQHKEAIIRDEFLAFGLIGISYGAALLAEAYGFLAVFAAGFALRRISRRHSDENPPADVREAAKVGAQSEIPVNPEKAPAYMVEAVLASNERAERLFEFGMVLLLGLMFRSEYLTWSNLFFTMVLLVAIRPAAVFAGLMGKSFRLQERGMISWFGIRGIGSIYYLMHAISHGVNAVIAKQFIGLTLTVIGVSILAHGISVTPLMKWHTGKQRRK